MDDVIMLVIQIVPVVALAASGIWYVLAQRDITGSYEPVAKTSLPVRARPSLSHESFAGFVGRTWLVVPLVYGFTALLRWIGGDPDVAAVLFRRPPLAGSIYGYVAMFYLARDIWRVRKPLGALLIGRGGWAGIKAAHASAYAARSTPKAA